MGEYEDDGLFASSILITERYVSRGGDERQLFAGPYCSATGHSPPKPR